MSYRLAQVRCVIECELSADAQRRGASSPHSAHEKTVKAIAEQPDCATAQPPPTGRGWPVVERGHQRPLK